MASLYVCLTRHGRPQVLLSALHRLVVRYGIGCHYADCLLLRQFTERALSHLESHAEQGTTVSYFHDGSDSSDDTGGLLHLNLHLYLSHVHTPEPMCSSTFTSMADAILDQL